MLHLEGDVIQHRLVGIRILFDQMIHLETLAGRFGFSHSTTSFPVGGPQWTAAHDEVHKENHAINPQGSSRELESVRVDNLLADLDDLDHTEQHGQ